MKTVFSLIQTKIALAILGVLIVIASFIGYQEVKERGAEIAAQRQNWKHKIESAQWILSHNRDSLQSSRKTLQNLTQHKKEVIREKGSLWYEDFRSELKDNIFYYQTKIQEQEQDLKQYQQKLKELELQPLFAF